MIRVKIPHHLSVLAQVGTEIAISVEDPITLSAVLDALEALYPVLRGTVRDQVTGQRRPFLRFFACGQDISHELPDVLLPDEIASGKEPLFIIGAIAGG